MSDTPTITPASDENDPDTLATASSELNNLLQIIAGTGTLIEGSADSAQGSQEYLSMLRSSIKRAEIVAAQLVQRAGGTDHKALMHPDLSGFVRARNAGASKTKKGSIVIVDDEEMTLVLVKRILSDAGFDVATASSGFQCLDVVRRQPHSYDLVLLDLTMPFMDGEETFKRLREIRADLPVVLCTGFIQQERLSRLLTAGLSGFLRKPISATEIVSFVQTTLQSVKYARGSFDPYNVAAAAI